MLVTLLSLITIVISFIAGIFCRVIWEACEKIGDDRRAEQCKRRMRHFDKRMMEATTDQEREAILKAQSASIAKIYGI